jgi:uncharacterized phage-associated protein
MTLFDSDITLCDTDVVLLAEQPALRNRVRLKALCRLAGSYFAAAQRIAKQTQRPLSVESIKAWTCDPATTRARPCPDWAIKALERNLKRRQ